MHLLSWARKTRFSRTARRFPLCPAPGASHAAASGGRASHQQQAQAGERLAWDTHAANGSAVIKSTGSCVSSCAFLPFHTSIVCLCRDLLPAATAAAVCTHAGRPIRPSACRLTRRAQESQTHQHNNKIPLVAMTAIIYSLTRVMG